MGFHVEQNVTDVGTVRISGETLDEFTQNYKDVGGIKAFAELMRDYAGDNAMTAIKEKFPDAEEVTDQATVATDELAELIRNAPDKNAILALWRANKDKWAPYNDLAKKRTKELEKAAKK